MNLQSTVLRLGTITNTGGCITVTKNGKRAIVHGGLPYELVEARSIKENAKLDNYIVTKVLEPSIHRRIPLDDHYFATSPWQIMDFEYENVIKSQLIVDAFRLNKITIDLPIMKSSGNEYEYRNKFTYKFVANSYQLGVTERLSNKVIPIQGSALVLPEIHQAAKRVQQCLEKQVAIKPEHLNQLIVRTDKGGKLVVHLLLNTAKHSGKQYSATFDNIENVEIAISRNKLNTRADILWKKGDTTLVDNIFGQSFSYDVRSFFQTNLPAYEMALRDMQRMVVYNSSTSPSWSKRKVVDLYSGVGSIGLSLVGLSGLQVNELVLVDISERNDYWAQENIRQLGAEHFAKSFCVPANRATQYITPGCTLILDPPRAGISTELVQVIREVKPAQILYLSCNPSTLGRDIYQLLPNYRVQELIGYNFFSKTTHIEVLGHLKLRNFSMI